ncbi:MAG: DUF4167 domain-containing protein [Planktomarina sp.]
MRNQKPRNRNNKNRNNNNRNMGNVMNRVFDSSGPEGKVRGTPQQIIEKYSQLARDAQLAGDRVAFENFQQHSEHYSRILAVATKEQDVKREQQERENAEKQAQRDAEREQRDAERAQRDAERAERDKERAAAIEAEDAPQPDVAAESASDDAMAVIDEPDAINTEEASKPKPRRRRAPAKPKADTAPQDAAE